MRDNRSSIFSGLVLIILGIISLITFWVPGTWPLILIGLGVCFLVAIITWCKSGLAITATTNLVLGCILLYQSLTQDWESWYYLWPLLFCAVGGGMLLERLLEPSAQWTHGSYKRVGLAFLCIGILGTIGLWVLRAQLEWPVIIWGMGLLFILVALASQLKPLIIPGVILTGLGLLLAWQKAGGNWYSWSYTWALIPGIVGLSLFLAFRYSRIMRIIGLSMVGWSLVAFVFCATIFAQQGAFIPYWPITLILAGGMVFAQTSIIPRRTKTKQ